MALLKEIQTPTGYTAGYHLISDVSISFKKKVCEVVVLSFKDEQTRHQPGSQPLAGRRVEWRGQNFPFTNTPTSAHLWTQLYEALKATDDFINAEDA